MLLSEGGAGVAGAEVRVDDKLVVRTQSDGSYLLDSMKATTYNLQVRFCVFHISLDSWNCLEIDMYYRVMILTC